MKINMIVKWCSRAALSLGLAAFALAPQATAQQAAEDWNKVVDAAKKEGEVIIWGQSGESRRAYLKDAFEKAYPGIRVNLFQAPSSSQRDSRYEQEVKAGVFKADVFVTGGASSIVRFYPANMVRPIKPLLRPEILDAKNWVLPDGPLWMDYKKDTYLIADALAYPVATVNASVTDLKSFEDLLLPKYDNKIVMADPRKSGSGFAFMGFMEHEPNLGRDYIKKLFANNRIVFSQDERQNAEWVDSGRVLIGINIRPLETEALQKVGGTLKILGDLTAKGEKVGLVIGSDGVLWIPALDPLPHPNAARVYVNWFYSKAGAQALVDNMDTGTNIAGVDTSKVSQWSKPRPGVRYLNMMQEKINNNQATGELRKFLETAISGS